MKILVIMKQTFDTEAQIVLKDGKIEAEGVKQILNPYDEYAVEEAVQLKEKNGGEVIAVGIGDAAFEGTLRHVLAMGCDRAVVLDDPALQAADARGQAAALAAASSSGVQDLLISAPLVFPFDAAHQIQDILRERIFARVVPHDL